MAAKHILIIGATGPSGLLLIEHALAKGHKVTVFARTPSKFPAELREKIDVVQGTLEDTAALTSAIATHPDAIISLLGPTDVGYWFNPFNDHTIFVTAYKRIFEIMQAEGVKRIYLMSTISAHDPADKPDWKRSAMVWVIWTILNAAWRNIIAVDKMVQEAPEEIEWTEYRLGAVVDGESEGVQEGYVGDGKTGYSVRRAEIAEWLVGAVEQPEKWVRARPMLSSVEKKKV